MVDRRQLGRFCDRSRWLMQQFNAREKTYFGQYLGDATTGSGQR
jgi:hypothetical protein